MKNELIKFTSSYFFRQRKRFSFSGTKDSSEHLPEMVKPESEIADILRWADDGGKMLPLNSQGTPGSGSGTSKRMINEGR